MKCNSCQWMAITLLVLPMVVCNEFAKLNLNPNSPTEVPPSTLLTNSLRSISNVLGAIHPGFYVQHLAETQYTANSRYQQVYFSFNGWYTGALADLEHIIDLNTDKSTRSDALAGGSNNNQIAVARILKVYFFSIITDRWGPVPYSQALQGRANFRPAYDDQESIYQDFFRELEQAVRQIEIEGGLNGDILFYGDMNRWIRFANSLRMVLALRLSEVDPASAQAEFITAWEAGVIGDGEDIKYPFLAETQNQNPWFSYFITRTDFAISETLVNYMKPLNDPRLVVYADPAPNYGEVMGMPYGIAGAGDIPNAEISFPGYPAVRGQDAPLAILSRAQILFSLAEAAHREWIEADQESLYYRAIGASLHQWEVYDEAAFQTYITQPGVKWESAKAMELIANQKWVALYMQGYEAWAEWRRLNLPTLVPAPDALNASRQIPVRQGFPTSERDLNGANYEAAIQVLGGEDGLDTKVWWDR